MRIKYTHGDRVRVMYPNHITRNGKNYYMKTGTVVDFILNRGTKSSYDIRMDVDQYVVRFAEEWVVPE